MVYTRYDSPNFILKVIIRVAQITILMPFDYNFHTGKFQKSKLWHNYCIIMSLLFTSGQSILSILWLLFYMYMQETDFVTLACFIGSAVLCTFQVMIAVYQYIYHPNEIMNILNNLKESYQFGNVKKYKGLIYLAINIYVLNYVLQFVLIINTTVAHQSSYSPGFRITLITLGVINLWANIFIYPLYAIFQIIIVAVRNINFQIENIIFHINKYKIHKNSVIHHEIDNISLSYINLLNIIKRLNNYYQLQVILTVINLTFIYIRKTYFFTFTTEQYFHLNGIIFKKLFEYIFSSLFILKILILFIHSSHVLINECCRTNVLLRDLNVELENLKLINAVSIYEGCFYK